MSSVIEIGLALVALVFFVWLMIPSKSAGADGKGAGDDRIIDPSDSTQIGVLIGMTGGSIADAAAARFALQRFEEIHGRKPTVRDMGTVAGLMGGVR